MQSEHPDAVAEAFPDEEKLAAAVGVVQVFLAELNLSDRLYVGGFSQGALLATEIALQGQLGCHGLIILSGCLVHRKRWERLAKAHTPRLFFQSHGTQDAILAYEGALQLHQLLQHAGWNGAFYGFQGGHEIPPSILTKGGVFLESLG